MSSSSGGFQMRRPLILAARQVNLKTLRDQLMGHFYMLCDKKGDVHYFLFFLNDYAACGKVVGVTTFDCRLPSTLVSGPSKETLAYLCGIDPNSRPRSLDNSRASFASLNGVSESLPCMCGHTDFTQPILCCTTRAGSSLKLSSKFQLTSQALLKSTAVGAVMAS